MCQRCERPCYAKGDKREDQQRGSAETRHLNHGTGRQRWKQQNDEKQRMTDPETRTVRLFAGTVGGEEGFLFQHADDNADQTSGTSSGESRQRVCKHHVKIKGTQWAFKGQKYDHDCLLCSRNLLMSLLMNLIRDHCIAKTEPCLRDGKNCQAPVGIAIAEIWDRPERQRRSVREPRK
jgi:hypothetical protein